MSITVNLGKVRGNDAEINNNQTTEVSANNGVILTQSGSVASLSVDFNVVQEKLSGNVNQLVGFDADGNAVPVPSGYELYGFELNMDETYGPNMIRYISQNTEFAPAHMDYANAEFDYGDWENAWFIKDLKPCVLRYNGTVAYYLNPNNYAQKIDGTSSDIGNENFAGNVMIGIPTVWIKVDTTVARKPKFYFSSKQLDAGFKAYAHHDNNGNIMAYTYMPAYNGWVDASGRLRSISGKAPTLSQAGDVQITEARANNPAGFDGWDIEKFVDRELINLLLMLISGTTDSQTAFGYGNGNGNANPATGADSNGILPSGTLDDKGLFYGYAGTEGVDDNLAVKVFGIENWWGNGWRRNVGIMISSGTYYYKLTKGTEDGSTTYGFDPAKMAADAGAPTGWISLGGGISGENGGITDMYVGEYGLLPKTVGGDYDSKYYDYASQRDTSNRFAACGGAATSTSLSGALGCTIANVLTSKTVNIFSCLSCKPNVSI